MTMTEQEFKINDVEVTVSCDVQVNVNEIQEFLRGRVELQDINASAKYFGALNLLGEEVEKRKIDFVAYAQSFNELQKYKEQKLDNSPTTEKSY
jgi:hypothetical protein